jgi:hypothetical protein
MLEQEQRRHDRGPFGWASLSNLEWRGNQTKEKISPTPTPFSDEITLVFTWLHCPLKRILTKKSHFFKAICTALFIQNSQTTFFVFFVNAVSLKPLTTLSAIHSWISQRIPIYRNIQKGAQLELVDGEKKKQVENLVTQSLNVLTPLH